jgi:tetratricopeptide (TPR) repeat protein
MHEMALMITEISNLIKEGEVTFLVGPGISQPAPSNLPGPREIISELLNAFYQKTPVLRRLFPHEEDFEESLEHLRFEELLQKLEDSVGILEVLDIFKGGTPNPIHYFLAKCLPLGNHIITTCIDQLMEKAYGSDNLKVYLANDDFETALQEIEKGEVPFSLFKVRGSIDNPDSLNVTADQIGQAGVGFANEEKKAEFFDKIVEKRHLVVLGYPGTDDFDIIPRLIYLKSRKKIYWLDHQPIKISLQPPGEDFEKNPNWEKIVPKAELLVLLYGETLEFVKKVYDNIFGTMPEPTGEKCAGAEQKKRLNEFLNQMVDRWLEHHRGLLEMISGLLLYEGNLREKALRCFLEAEKRFSKQGNLEGAARAMTNLSVVYTDQMNYGEAIKYLEKSGNIYLQMQDIPGLAVTARNIASLLLARGEWKKALTQFEESRKLYKQCKDIHGYAAVTSTMAQIYTDLGEYEKATHLFYESNTAYKECGDIKGYAMSLGNSGRLLYAQNQLEEAEFLFKIALHTLTQLDDQEGISKISNNLGMLYGKLGHVEEAERAFNKAVTAGKKVRDKTVRMDALLNKGTLYLMLGKLENALKSLNKGLEMAENMDNPERYGQALGNIGLALLDFGKAEESMAYFKRAMKVFAEIGAPIEVAFTHENLGDAYRDSGNQNTAYKHYETSIELLEDMRGIYIEESTKLSFQSRTETVYDHMINLCLKIGKKIDAYEYTEKSRSKTFVDLLAAANISPPDAVPGKLRQKEDECLTLLRQVYSKQVSTRNVDTEKLLKDRDNIYRQMEKTVPEYVYLRKGKPMTFEEVKACLK